MEKVKVDMTAKPEVWTDVMLEDGAQVKIRNYLPYAEREEAAAEYAARALVVADEENGIVYDSYRIDIEWDYVMVKYYTNIDVDGIPTEDMFDYAKRTGLLETIKEIAGEDVYLTLSIGDKMAYAVTTAIEKRGSLPYFIKNRMGYLLDAEKTAGVLAQAEDLKEKMIDILGTVKEHDAMKSAQKRPTVITGGVNLAKK